MLADLPLKTIFAVVDKMVEVAERLIPEQLVDELIFLLDELRRKLVTTGRKEALDELVYRSEAKIAALEDVRATIPKSEAETSAVETCADIDSKVSAFKSVLEVAKPLTAEKETRRVRKRRRPISKEDIRPTSFLFPETEEGEKATVDTSGMRARAMSLPKDLLKRVSSGRPTVEEPRVRIGLHTRF